MHFFRIHGRTWLRWAPVLFFAVTIFMFSATPGEKVTKSLDHLKTTTQVVSSTGTKEPILLPKIEWLKIAHGIGYFSLGLSVLYALDSHSRKAVATAAALCCFYSLTDEFHQTFTPGRSASGLDILLDSLSALAGILILSGIMKWKSRAAISREAAG
jgi:VanZ family protein